MQVEVIVEEAQVVAVEEEVAVAGEAAEAAAAAAEAAAEAAAAVEVVTMMTMTMMGHLSVYQVPPIVARDVGSSMIKKWNSN